MAFKSHTAGHSLGQVAGLAPTDLLIALFLLVGVAFQLFHRRLPAGLGTSLFVASVTIGLSILAVLHGWFEEPIASWHGAERAHISSRMTAGLTLFWALLGSLSRLRRADEPSSARTFFAWSLVTGIATVIVHLYILVFTTWQRIAAPEGTFQPILDWTGLLHLFALVLSVLLWRGVASRGEQPGMFLTLFCMIAWWSALMVPPANHFDSARSPPWWNWTLALQIGLAFVLVGGVVLQDLAFRRRRNIAGPDRLDELVAPFPRPPALSQLFALVAGAVLVLGVYQLVRRSSWSLPPVLIDALVVAVASAACLFVVYRQWNAATAELGLGLIGLFAAAIGTAVAGLFVATGPRAEYANRMPVIFNGILVGLALTSAHFYWLSRFWKQQLLDGQPWTTAGRMIPHARRVSFLILAMSVLLAFQLALWTEMVPSAQDDNSPARIICGILAIALLARVGMAESTRTGSPAPATFCVATIIAGILFCLVRAPASIERGWLFQYSSVVLSLLCLPILALAETAPNTRWRTFALPLWFLALLFLPARALWVLLSPERLPADWVRPMTLAILGAVYTLAGNREGRRPFQVLGAVLLLAALLNLYQAYRGWF